MKRLRVDESPSRLRAIPMLASFLLLISGGCGVSDPAGGGGAGGDAGHGGASPILDRSAEDASFTHDPRWDPPDGLAEAIVSRSNATACTSGPQCPTGYCVDGFCCDSKCDNKCMACSAAKKGSGVDGICGSIKYDTDPDNDCPYGACDGKNMCKNYTGFSCTSTAQCLSNYCVDGFCCNNICMSSCQACSAAKKGSGQDGVCGSIKVATDPDNECSNGDCNGSGACTTSPQPTSPNGTTCTSAAQCASGYCADGVCCDSWCIGTCQACTAAKKNQGTDGTCGNIANDKDPDEECWGGACNGAGVCKQYNGVPCSDKSQCLSNYCVDGFCCGNICTGWCYACSEARKGGGYDGACGPILSGRDPDNECSPGECNGSGTCNQPQTPLTNGSTCIASAQCASGNCVDGYCCDTACNETCKACSTAKKGSGANGTCGNIAAETDPDSECGYGGRCGGNGTCRYYNGLPCTSTSQCFSNYCADGVCCGNICNQTCYACSAAKKGQGPDGACGPIANTRDPDNECNPGECNGSGTCNQAQIPQSNGTACTLASQCASGFCIDGVCCDTACTESCKACSATKKGQGTSGTCGPIIYDTDPDNECYGGACSGSGTCQFYNGLACTQTSQCLSNYCVDGFCCNNHCGLTCYACSAAKKGSGQNGTCGVIANNADPDNECGLTCNGAGACIRAPVGAFCSSAADCLSGFCADGFCCNNACGGTCEACSVPGSEGTCSNACPGPCTGTVGLPSAPFPQNIAFPVDNRAVDSADFNHDGLADLVVCESEQVYILMGQGNGTFGAPSQNLSGNYPRSVVASDLNADGFADVIVRNTANGGLTIFLNQGNGTFGSGTNYATNYTRTAMFNRPDMVTVADFNGDGIKDVATINDSDVGPTGMDTTSVFFGHGDGTFATAINIPTPDYPKAIATGDFNADGFVDLALGTKDTTTGLYRLTVMNGQNGGSFAAPVHYPVGSTFASLTVADLNGDGRLDVATLGKDGQPVTRVYVFLNQGNGTFANPVQYDGGGDGRIIATNLNGDAFVDLIVAMDHVSTIAVFLGQGNGAFAPRVDCLVSGRAYALVAADIDNDNDQDIVVATNNGVALRKNSGTGNLGTGIEPGMTYPMSDMRLSADVNGDGRLDLVGASGTDIQIALGQGNGTFGALITSPGNASSYFDSIALGDMNGDGKPDVVGVMNYSQIGVRLNQGNGTFGAIGATYPTYSNPGTVVVGDFSGDGKLDVATSGFKTTVISVSQGLYEETVILSQWSGQGNGLLGSRSDQTLLVAETLSTGWPRTCPIAGGDFNGDGKMDLAISDQELYGWNPLINQGGSFVMGPRAGFTASGMYPADLNGDGQIDMAYIVKYVNTLHVALNLGGGTFGTSVEYPAALEVHNLISPDLNGDGAKDLAFLTNANTVGVMLNQGNGALGERRDYGVGASPSALAAGDWNSDSRIDLAVQNGTPAAVSLLRNTCLP